MPDFSFRPRSGRYGVMVTLDDAGIPPATPLTATATKTYAFSPIFRPTAVLALAASAITVPTGGAAITATIKKWSVSANAFVTLASGFDLTALVANVTKAIPFDAAVTPAQKVLQPGDTLYVDLIAVGTVTVNAVSLTIAAERAVLQ